jgi:hyperosmotically inducible protein
MKNKLAILAGTMILGVLGGVHVAQGAVARLSDTDLAAQVTKRLRDANFDSVGVTVNGGTATLTGAVDRLSKAERAYQIAKKTNGLSAVDNKIAVRSEHSDTDIARDVTHAIRMYPYYDIFDLVNGDVKDGVVTLRGAVHLPVHASAYVNLAKEVSGVKVVKNELEVLPLSNFDDQIRLRVARAIYGSGQLGPRYGIQALPPIHIIVKNGNVRLEGVVGTQIDKQIAEQKARFAATYFGFENNLLVVKG